MKILDKQAVATLKAKERKQEIDEGVKIARTIDILREAKADEERKLQLFREGTMAIIKSEIENKLAEKKRLTEEVEAIKALYNSLKEKVEYINSQIKKI